MSLHERLRVRFSWYRNWHAHPRATFWNFTILIIVSLIVEATLLFFITKTAAELENITLPASSDQRTKPQILRSTEKNLTVAFFGDQGVRNRSKQILRLVRDEGAAAAVILGDFDYIDNPELWDKQNSDILGEEFPIFAIPGNHEVKKFEEYLAKISGRLERIAGAKCTGKIAIKYTCKWKGLLIVLVSPNIIDAGHDLFIRRQLAEDDSFWSVCGWHKTQNAMQVGSKHQPDDIGWEVYEECRKGGGFIVTGHSHTYSRTHLLGDFENQSIVSTSSTLKLEAGKSFAVVSGLGGKSRGRQEQNGEWWASVYTASQEGSYGVFFCTFHIDDDPRKARCYFKNIEGNIIDDFTLESRLE